MPAKKINGELFKKMVTNGAINLKNHHKEIDFLNVFPVPDGDTGTNMQMTMMAGIKEINNSQSHSIVDISKILQRGLLTGARGNSGVILSQFFRGVSAEMQKITTKEASIKEFIKSLVGGYQMAYRAVISPVEGTILTVVRESAEAVAKKSDNFQTVDEALKEYLAQAKKSLKKTPELLPILKEAGVVDSGAAGFIKIIEGMLMALNGQILDENVLEHEPMSKTADVHELDPSLIKFAYCTEFLINLNGKAVTEEALKQIYSKLGDSLVVVLDENVIKIHVHTNQPGVVVTIAQKYGDLSNLKIENMKVQNESFRQDIKKPRTEYGIIAVCNGDGIKETFKELGVDYIIDGGQTLNPSTQSFLNAIEAVNADNIIILPNNSNIILTAEQAITLQENKNVRVLATRNIAQGYSSLIAFDLEAELDDNVEAMTEMCSQIRSGEVTYAVRDTELFGVKIKAGDFIGINGKTIEVSKKSRLETTKKLIKSLISDDASIVTLFYGIDVPANEVTKIVNYIKSLNESIEIEVINGKQDIYSYILAVE